MPFFKKEQKAINDKWYPRTVTVGHPVEMDEVCDRIAEMSTASKADSKAVLTALGQVLGSLMNTGRTRYTSRASAHSTIAAWQKAQARTPRRR